MTKKFWTTLSYSGGYLLLTLLCLMQWSEPDRWSRVDVFSGSYLGLRALGSIHSIVFSRKVFRSSCVMREWWALTSDPGGIKWVVLLMVGDLAVFLDYGHWHLSSALERPTLQGLGLGLYLGVAAWQMWADTYLARYFTDERLPKAPMNQGPFRYVRHPRYVGAMWAKVAFALVFASLLGWGLALAWGALFVRKIQLEEGHLRQIFGREYETYAQHTARLLPRVY